ncbi:mfs general substrate transporter [Fusarium langsethiae]|uniref:Mfs general substrate transporter n=1 Tax=Fusarium langsethiae TaxID=179993 RepID=A0A0N0V5G6_FUSLA|nr:mfs general substrate transporter [Fusarium langsethiae]
MLTTENSQPELVDEKTPLTSSQCIVHDQGAIKIPHEESQKIQSHDNGSVARSILPTLLFGMFIAQADSSIVLVTSQEIAFEFNVLSDASWLITSYVLAQCVCQPLYGRTSDIFWRKPAMIFSYSTFTLGCIICGIGTRYWHVLLGRVVSGIGGAGMVGLVAVIIADLLPPRQVATWRSYVNVVATLGRSCGGPLGGWLVDTVGWRWCFVAQSPLAALAVVLIIWKLPANIAGCDAGSTDSSIANRLRRVDFIGFALLPAALIVAFLALDQAGKLAPWHITVPLGVCAVILLVTFWYVEKSHAQEPVIPMDLLAKRDVYIPYLIIALQTASQFIITYTIPIYFPIVANMSVASAGSRIVFIVVGNAAGGLLTGWYVSRTGRYKSAIYMATTLGVICYCLVLVRWHGRSSLLDSSYLVLGKLGMGSTQSTTFVYLAVALGAKDIAIAGTTWFLCQSAGSLVAANVFNMVHNLALTSMLQSALEGVTNKTEANYHWGFFQRGIH